MTTPWEVINSINHDGSDFSILTMNQSNVSQATVISKRSAKGNIFLLIEIYVMIYCHIFSIQPTHITAYTCFKTINTKTIDTKC
jgi:hypothetical protein